MTDPKENFCAVSSEIRPSSASAISTKASYSRPEIVASFSFSRTTPKKSTTAPCSAEKTEGKGSKDSRVTFTSHRCMTAFYAGSAAICKAWMQPVRKTRPEEVCRTLPRSGYTEQPRALALGYAWCKIRPESGGRGRSLGCSRVIPTPPIMGCHFPAFAR